MLEPRVRYEAPPDTSDLLDALHRIARMAETGELGIGAVALDAVAEATRRRA
jgi:hypothetical protein